MARTRRVLVVMLGAALAMAGTAATPASAVTYSTGTVVRRSLSLTEINASKTFWTATNRRTARSAHRPVTAASSTSVVPRRSASATVVPSGGARTAVVDPGPGRLSPTVGAPWSRTMYYPPRKSTGRLFFRLPDGAPSYCSASTINSAGRNLVLTAGHCVYSHTDSGHGKGYHHTFMFAPGYDHGNMPWGTWNPHSAYVFAEYQQTGVTAWDTAMMTMLPSVTGQRLYDAVGGPGIAWNGPYSQTSVASFGYVWANYSGEQLMYTAGPGSWVASGVYERWSSRLGLGMSGGPVWYDNASTSVPSLGFGIVWSNQSGCDNKTTPTFCGGPYYGDQIANMYNYVRNG